MESIHSGFCEFNAIVNPMYNYQSEDLEQQRVEILQWAYQKFKQSLSDSWLILLRKLSL